MRVALNMFGHLVGLLTTLLFVVFTVIVFIPLMPLALLKWLVPFAPWQVVCNRWLDWLARFHCRVRQRLVRTPPTTQSASNA